MLSAEEDLMFVRTYNSITGFRKSSCTPQRVTTDFLAPDPHNHELLLMVFFMIQGSQIRIYDVESGWKVQKNIHARSLRWTITDTSLSPNQRHLVGFLFYWLKKHANVLLDLCSQLCIVLFLHASMM